MSECQASPSCDFDALVFDLDGVVVDTERLVHQAWTELFHEHGCSFSAAEWAMAIGTDHGFAPYEALLARSRLEPPSFEEVERRVESLVRAELIQSGPLPGVLDWLAEADELGLATALASSSPADWAERRLRDVGLLERFPVRATRSATLPAKPQPHLYLEACRRAGVAPTRALAIEDSVNGLSAAVAAGLTCVAVPGPLTAHLDFAPAALVMGSLEDASLGDVLARLDTAARGEHR